MKLKVKKNSDAVAILDQMAGRNSEVRRLTEQSRFNARVAQMIYDARTAAGLTQGELAKRVGTKQSVISRLEDAVYEGHSLRMLQKIAASLGQKLEIRFTAGAKRIQQRSKLGSRF